MRPKIRLTDEERRQELLEAMAADPSPSGVPAERLLAVCLAYGGKHSLEEIAGLVGRARSRVAEWVADFRTGGVEGLRPARRGRPASGAAQAREKSIAAGLS